MIESEINTRGLKLRPYQWDFVNGNVKFPAFVSAWGTGKTMCGLVKAVDLSLKYPNNLGMIFRKEYEDLKTSTCKDFEILTQSKIPTSREVTFANGSKIVFTHLEELNNLQNINLGFFFLNKRKN